MQFKTTYLRNRAMLVDYLDKMMVEDIMEKYNASKAMVTGGMRQALETIQEHTDYVGGTSLEMTLLLANKVDILHYMKQRIPTTSLTSDAKKMLREKFGEHYGLVPDVVAERWDKRDFERGRYPYYRPLESIRTWLASEGYLVDNYLSQDMIDDTFDQMLTALKAMPKRDGLAVEVTEGHLDKRIAYFNATISQDNHVANRRFKLEFIPTD